MPQSPTQPQTHYIKLEDQYGCHNYHPLPVVLTRGQGIYLYDTDGRQYMDFLASYSAVNQGHCHPKIVQSMIDQAQILTLTSRAFYNDKLGLAEKYLCETFTYQKALLMNSGAEAVESAIKLARRWGYDKKGIPADEAIIVVANENFHGRTTTIVSFSSDPESYGGFGPKTPGFVSVPYNDVESLRAVLTECGNKVCAFLVEPVQGEAGVKVPAEGYLRKVHELCQSHNVLLICDEIQSGLGRTGKLLACHWEDVRPEMVLLGKALSGGTMPVSAVLADDDVMLCIKPGQHGSTFGGNPLACSVMIAALDVLKEEDLVENSRTQGELLLSMLKGLQKRYSGLIREVRGRGLMVAMDINAKEGLTAWQVCLKLRDLGLLAKQTHDDTIRLTPPLCITSEQLQTAFTLIEAAMSSFSA